MWKRKLTGVALLALAACGNYDVSLNDRVVYTPEPLFEDFQVTDPALQACLKKAVQYYKVTVPAQLVQLDCHGKEVESLAGIGTFNSLQQISLAHNRVSDLAPLLGLSSLQILDLRDNRVVDPVPLYELISLRALDLSGNPDLRCPARQDLVRVVDLVLPKHCPH